MSDDIGQLLSPGSVTRVGQGLPRRDQQQPPPRKRRPPDSPPPKQPGEPPLADEEPRTVGSRLNVHA